MACAQGTSSMLSIAGWLRGLLLGSDAAREQRDNDTHTQFPFLFEDVPPPENRGTGGAAYVWDRDPHMALQVERHRALQEILSHKGLPPELVCYILVLSDDARMLSVTRAEDQVYTNDANVCHLQTPPLPSKLVRHFVARIVVDTDSHDQGWSSDPMREWIGTYQGSYTWWELSLHRKDPEATGAEAPKAEVPGPDDTSEVEEADPMPGYTEVHRTHLTHNIHGSRDFRRHTITLERGHPILEDARPGDVLCLWARTQFMAWTNFVRYARISVWLDWDA